MSSDGLAERISRRSGVTRYLEAYFARVSRCESITQGLDYVFNTASLALLGSLVIVLLGEASPRITRQLDLDGYGAWLSS